MNAFFGQMPISRKLSLILLVSLTGLLVSTAIPISHYHSSLLNDRELKTRHLVEATLGVLRHFQAQEQNGSLSQAQAQQQAMETVRAMRYGGKEYFWINDTQLRMVMHTAKPELDGKDLSQLRTPDGRALFAVMTETAGNGGGFVHYLWPKPGSDTPQPKISYVAGFKPWGWVLGTGIYVDDVQTAFIGELKTAALVTVLIIAVMGTAIFFLAGTITRPIEALRQVMDHVAANNDLTERADDRRGDELGRMAKTFNHMLDSLNGFVRHVHDASNQLAEAAGSLAVVTEQTATNVLTQRSHTDQAATAMEEMTASVQEIARNAAATAEATRHADNEASGGKREVATTIETINALASEVGEAAAVVEQLRHDSEGVEKVLEVIVTITEQTNLLALNAAIEAARAGESGRGFAVVADEVRSLAQRTQQSAADIRTMIETLQSRAETAVTVMTAGREHVETSVEQAARAGAALERITGGVARITEMTAQIAATAEQQSHVTADVDRNMAEITQMAEDTAHGADQTARSSEGLNALADSLRTMVERYRV